MVHRDTTDTDLSDFRALLTAPYGSPPPSDEEIASQGRRRRRRGWIAAAVTLAVVLGPPAGYALWALNAPLKEAAGGITVPGAPQPSPAVDLGFAPDGSAALSVAGAEPYLGPEAAGLWVTHGGDDARPIASITKIITALVVLDAHPLGEGGAGPTLTFSRADHALYDAYFVRDATIAPMPTGSSMSLRDALATMLIPSASNYAESIAVWAFGSVSGFRSAAARWLDANGLQNTNIVEPTGLDPRNTSTPSDMIALGRIAAAEPTVAAIAATPSLTLPGPGRLVNTNGLLGENGITGLKTGTLDESGANLLYTASIDVGLEQPLDIVGVALGGSTQRGVAANVRGVLERLVAGFHGIAVSHRGKEIGSYTTAWGSSARVVLADNAALRTWSDTPIEVASDIREPVDWVDGEVLGSVTWTAGPESVTVDVVLEGDIEPPSDWWRLTHPGEIG
ncbi:D-alanyl-D-alanine carboxypeptidase family protein [Microbacterium sp. cf332]|uniref:D-alanyl-D-alanine carboxypeptidase family protein n=1 Tax=Microbacterium sp. cf332 TaxID=1761804 RepID=UPI00088F5FB0|nr:serine hydrolase [Microbacterium sp. cf332]SDQ85189.1 D-alanyl-D-alanine carboxypeptidase (penicillin-binding protein 5/6) [Microbacterium sp. cf332]